MGSFTCTYQIGRGLPFLESFNGVVYMYLPDRPWTTIHRQCGIGGFRLQVLFSWGMDLFTMARSLDEHSNFTGYYFPGTSANCFSLLHIGQDAEWEKSFLFVDNVSLVHILNKQSSRSDRVISFH